MKKNALASLLLAFATAFALADNLGTTSLVGDLSSTSNYVYTADQADAVFATRVPTNRTVNGHALSGNVTITASELGAVTSVKSSDGTEFVNGSTATLPTATTSAAGLMSATDKEKLNGIESDAQVNVLEYIKLADNMDNIPVGPDKTISIPKAASLSFGVVMLSDATDGTETTTGGTAATPAAVKAAKDAATAAASAASSAASTANTAVQSVKISGSSTELKSGTTATIPVASTSAAGVVQLSTSTNGTSTAKAATESAVKDALAGAKAYTDSAVSAGSYTHPTYTARTGKPTANATPTWGGTFTVSQIKSDTTGHVTDAVDRTITIPSAAATTSAAGLMSAADKTALDSLSSGSVLKTTVSAALTAQGITSADDIDTLNETIAELKKVIAVLEALD